MQEGRKEEWVEGMKRGRVTWRKNEKKEGRMKCQWKRINDEYTGVYQNGNVEQQVGTIQVSLFMEHALYSTVQHSTIQYNGWRSRVNIRPIYTYITRLVSHMARHACLHRTIYLFIWEKNNCSRESSERKTYFNKRRVDGWRRKRKMEAWWALLPSFIFIFYLSSYFPSFNPSTSTLFLFHKIHLFNKYTNAYFKTKHWVLILHS